jgi:hypothetical protein
MGQGRLIPSCCRRVILIAVAIQGLTPDLHDLTSSSALRFLCPYRVDSSTFPVDDDSPDDVCELIPWSLRLERSRDLVDLGPAGLASVAGFAESRWSPIADSSLDIAIVPRVHPSIYELCRLAC